jgi:hypothetical protein
MARTIGEAKFLETLEKCISRAARTGEDIIQRDKATYEADKRANEGHVKKMAKEYATSVKAVKEVTGIRKILTAAGHTTSSLLDIAESQAKSTVDKVEGYNTLIKGCAEQLKNVEDNEKDLEFCKKNADKEFALVKKLLSTKFITDMRYESGVGLFWKYQPMVYMADGKGYFLGRPEAGFAESGPKGFILRLPSYPYNIVTGTFHMKSQEDGSNFCLGGYSDMLYILAAKRNISGIIRLFREYYQSYNAKSVHLRINEHHINMDINLPKVTDDSWEVWKKENPKFKMPPMAAITTPDHEGECSSCGDERTLNGDNLCADCR